MRVPVVSSLWAEPRPPDAPRRVWRDWALVAILVPTAIAEGLLRTDPVVWRPLVTVLAVVLTPLLLWRRTHPLLCVTVGFGAGAVLGVAAFVAGVTEDVGLYTMVWLLLLVYAVVRWGSGREVVVGLGVVLATAVVSVLAADDPAGDVVGAFLVLFALAAVGAVFRYRADADRRRATQIRTEERVGLARELHDTVAHHVSAIAVQAQAGRAVADRSPEDALRALATIEQEATRTLAEMRTMVRVLRDGDEPELAPLPGVRDLPALARSAPAPRVEIRLAGDLTGLPGQVDTAVYRMAQESLTNALRHAAGAGLVTVEVTGTPETVTLRVRDDGRPGPLGAGYGLLGMTERAHLLRGTFRAGPDPAGGWTVHAALPRDGHR